MNCPGIFLIGGSCPAKCLDHLNTFYVLHDRAVHMSIGLIVLRKALATDHHRQAHQYHRKRQRH